MYVGMSPNFDSEEYMVLNNAAQRKSNRISTLNLIIPPDLLLKDYEQQQIHGAKCCLST